jgi:diguanylate cyclase (GGDEF)-like protein
MGVPAREPAATFPALDATADRGLMTRCLAYLFGAGATLALVTLPEASSADAVGILISQTGYALAAIILLAILLVNFGHLPLWTFQLTLAAGTGLISFVIYSSGDPTSAYTMFYLWIVLYAFYFFRPLLASLQLVVVALAYGGVLHWKETIELPGTRWLITIATLVVSGILIALLKSRVDKLVQRLTQTARTDPLTSLFNRRGFDETFDAELERANRSGQPMSVVLLDLDKFKSINDAYGHDAGDDVLQRVGGVMRANKRRIDTAARVGGEEFALILPYSDADGAKVVAERFRERVMEAFANEDYTVTTSLGVASFPIDGTGREELLRASDRALYTAKRLGRNRSVLYSEQEELGGTSDHADAPLAPAAHRG